MARLTIQEKWRVNLLPDSVNHSLSANFPEKEFFASEAKLTICTHLNRMFAYPQFYLA